MAPPDWLRDPRTWLALVLGVAALTLVRPIYPAEQALQHAGTAAGFAFLVLAWRRWGIGGRAFAAFALFLVLHEIGARWVYSYVPYDAWCDAVFGFRPGETWALRRNHYDRFVHAAYGVLATPIFAAAAEHVLAIARRPAACVAVLVIAATSALYEIGEWLVARIAAPERAATYLGQQGDPWDAQADMALAIAGACATGVLIAVRGRRAAGAHSARGTCVVRR